ncbi:hypothetical protein PFLmoz3_04006 [Pseudomonas fluorescens]|uniref:Uncharacterized protein n=1 Tax=Pseudomonas fluorescens TaxID=294 RepID=A0A109LF79_PSEFL|nr:hypothetical protein PFLmoz3_04006 [Pseudomonas fluorescens]
MHRPMQRHAPHQSAIGAHRQGHRPDQERQTHRVFPVALGTLSEALVLGLLACAIVLVCRHMIAACQALYFVSRQLRQASLAHRRVEQAGVLADDLAVVRVQLAQHAGDRAFHDLQALAIEARQVHHQPSALAELQQPRGGALHHLALEALLDIAKQAPGTQAVTPIAQAAVDPPLFLQGQQHARHRGLGQLREVVQFFQPQGLVLAQQLDDCQSALNRAYGACLHIRSPCCRWMIFFHSKIQARSALNGSLQGTPVAGVVPIGSVVHGHRPIAVRPCRPGPGQ